MEIVIKPHAKQLDIVKHRKRFNVVRSGRRFGKSYLAFALALETMLETPGAQVLYTTPSYKELQGRYKDAVKLFSPLGAQIKWGEIVLNGSTLTLTGIWRADGLRGNAFNRMICDEWAYCDNAQDAWEEVLSPMLTDYEGDAFFFSTPRGKNHFSMLDNFSNLYDDWASFHFTTYDNPRIKHSEIERQREILPSVVFAQEYLAEYVDRDAAKIKREWLKIDNTKVCTAFYMGVDLAISQKETADYTAIVVIGVTEQKEIVIVDAYRDRLTFVNIGQKVVEYAAKWNPKVIAIESNQAQAWLIQELKRNTTLNVVGIQATRDKIIRFQPVEARFERREVYLHGTLPPEFTEELLSFTGTNQDKHDDFVDALGYAFAAIKKTPGAFT